ncbi:dephospho-CoA kinase [Aliamphritea ceti]|uniref:dephospho-CoA kinase n=1 Tax=Aliamphritea ceti TaxID=1524258 RepID=UPI0021C2D8F0|nr:dephospho-CoA kinase [Aliamphritea ceti]
MLIMGITGGIGSGKSSVSERFKKLGITIVDADIVAREVVQPGTAALNKISQHFGTETLNTDKSLNRSRLRSLIFASPKEREWLEALLHPLIRESIVSQLNSAASPYAILTSPLLLETDQHKLCHTIVVVDVTEEIQIERSCLRDNNSVEQIQKIIAAQIPRQERLDKANYIIDNSGPQSALNQQVSELHMQFLEASTI